MPAPRKDVFAKTVMNLKNLKWLHWVKVINLCNVHKGCLSVSYAICPALRAKVYQSRVDMDVATKCSVPGWVGEMGLRAKKVDWLTQLKRALKMEDYFSE